MLKSALKQARNKYIQYRLEAGEEGWGKPVAPPLILKGIGADRSYNVGVIGAGAQGLKQVSAIQKIPGIVLAGLADISPERLERSSDFNVPAERRFVDAESMLASEQGIDLVSIATTAPSHVSLGRVALRHGVKKILLEKPFDTSLSEARKFVDECLDADVELSVNYSRRWMIDYQAIVRCIEKGFIGDARNISISIGGGELAMHASHYFDLCSYLLKSEPVSVSSKLSESKTPNVRGAEYSDPNGHCLIGFENGARAFIDFSEDLGGKHPFITIKGTIGQITVDEKRAYWTLQSRSQKVWSFPFVEPLKAETLFSRVICELLSRTGPVGRYTGITSLEMIFAAHISSKNDGVSIMLPLSADQELPEVLFP